MLLGANLTSKGWWAAAAIRAIKTIAQTAIATIGTSVVLEDVNWITVCSASLLAGVLSMLTSLAGLPELQSKEVDESDEEEAADEEVQEDAEEDSSDEEADE